jgi:hypothetical protein
MRIADALPQADYAPQVFWQGLLFRLGVADAMAWKRRVDLAPALPQH